MRQLMCAAMMLGVFLTPGAIAQRGGAPGGGAGGFRGFGHSGSGAAGHFGGFAGRGTQAFGAHRFGGGSFPAFYSDWDRWDDDSYSQAPPLVVVVVVQQLPPPVVEAPPPPPVPARPVMQSYNWPASADDSAGAFSIVRTDGSVHPAILVWVQDGALHHTGPNGATEQTPLNGLDREATRRLNAANGLNLRLPADLSMRQAQAEEGLGSRPAQILSGAK